MKLGQIVTRYPQTFHETDGEKNAPRKAMKGRVVYIHPLGRYHVAIESEGKKLCRPVKHGINNKVTCARCNRRRYGMTYELVDTKSKA